MLWVLCEFSGVFDGDPLKDYNPKPGPAVVLAGKNTAEGPSEPDRCSEEKKRRSQAELFTYAASALSRSVLPHKTKLIKTFAGETRSFVSRL
ncbi:hypothetical protein GWI33_019768 [Rhynchophorus ferrugineus]|uniref:Uncharacterized protein n=1 Tax=Rhynchophorus ferrugineus TaxID=354439 RepID=A0A834HQS6_RHYFE|nr:hypothetical protein GWI33_019768 [Rhynchophorus ferrugineus]